MLVSGANDGSLCIWGRLPCGRAFSTTHVSLGEHTLGLRALIPIPPCALAPGGGFATGSLDKVVRIFAWDATTRTASVSASLQGHAGGVDSLTVRTMLGEKPQLCSAARDGTVRQWSLDTGKCVGVLEGHENSTKVIALGGGKIATGSAGRRDENNRHVDFKIRIWSPDAGGRLGIDKILTDHAQAVQDLDVLGEPSAGLWLSASNDGTVKARGADGTPFETIHMPPAPDGAPTAVFRVRALADGRIAAACEDNTLRIFNAEDVTKAEDEIKLPGTPWAVRGLANGDVAIGCTHAGSGSRGHVYIFSRDAARWASPDECARFTRDLIPPAKGGPMNMVCSPKLFSRLVNLVNLELVDLVRVQDKTVLFLL